MNVPCFFMGCSFLIRAFTKRSILSSSLLIFSYISVTEAKPYGEWYFDRLQGTTQSIYEKALEDSLGSYYGKVIAGLFPFLAQPDTTPNWVKDLFTRLDEMENNILESIADVRQDIKSEDLKAATLAIKEGFTAYDKYMIPSYAKNGSRANEFGEPTPLPMDRARLQSSESNINNSIQNLNKAVIILTSFLNDEGTKGQYDTLRQQAAITLRTILPYYVDLTAEYYNTYKWYKNSREHAFQQSYDQLLSDSVFLSNTNWVNQASNNAADHYDHLLGDIAPGEPHNYNGLSVIFTDSKPTYLQSIMETLQDEKNYQIETMLRDSVGEIVYQDPGKAKVLVHGELCNTFYKDWSYKFTYATSLGSSETETYKKSGSVSWNCTTLSKESSIAGKAQQDKDAVEAYRELLLENRNAEIIFNVNALYNPVFRSVFASLPTPYDSIDTEYVMAIPGDSKEMQAWIENQYGYKYHPAIFLTVNDDMAQMCNLSRFNYEGAFECFYNYGAMHQYRAWFNDNVTSIDNPEPLTSIFIDEHSNLYGMQADTSILHHYLGNWTTDSFLPPFTKVLLQGGSEGLAITRIIPTYDYTTSGGIQLRALGLQRDTGKIYYPNGNWWYEITDLFPREDLFTKRFIDLSINPTNSTEWWAITTRGEIFQLAYNKKRNNFSVSEVVSERNFGDETAQIKKPSNLIRILSYDKQTWAIDRDSQLYQWQSIGEDSEHEWANVIAPEEKIKQFAVAKSGTWALNEKGILHSYNDDEGIWQNQDEYFDYISVSDDYLYGILDGSVYEMDLR